MNSWLLLSFVLHSIHAISIGLIPNASLSLINSPSLITMNRTIQECLCAMVASSSISALNFFSNNTCQLFPNASLTNAYFSWKVDINSRFYFLKLPSGTEATTQDTTATSMVTTAVACTTVSSPLVGTTVFGSPLGISGSSLSSLKVPWSVTLNTDNSMLIVDAINFRVLRVLANASTGVVVADGGSWLLSRRAFFDGPLLNLFVIDCVRCLMTRYYNGSLAPITVFGNSSCGTNLTQFGGAASFCMDSVGNFYVADNYNHRIMFWAANSTTGVLLAGTTGVPGSDVQHLYNPQDITLDEAQGLFYVADTFNNRIIRFTSGSPNGTIVAGGNGPGVRPNQLNGPCALYLLKQTNALYIADTSNNRIVRWYLGDTQGVTIAGDCYGTAGTTALLLNTTTGITMDHAEMHLYVSDAQNNRIQMYSVV